MLGLVILGAVFIGYSLVAGRLERWSITAPMVFVAAGAVIGPAGIGVLDVGLDTEVAKVVTELTLGVLLFADAATLRWRDLRLDPGLPARLLLIGFPLTVVAGTLTAGWLVPGLGWAAAALVASILAPTDAALGLGVFSDRSVPRRIRRALNVESGLNDGLATPLVTLFLAVVVSEVGAGPQDWLTESLTDLVVAIVVAVVMGLGSGRLLVGARRRGWTSATSDRLAVMAIALVSYLAAVSLGGNGFVAAFAGGIFFAAATRSRLVEATLFTEDVGLFLSFLVWSLFGAALVGPILTGPIDLAAIGYAILSLTLIRMVPVAIAMSGAGLRPSSTAFMGWFGPRGLASVVFTIIAFEALEGSGLAVERLVEVATWTILLSVVAHGLTARPLAAAYGRSVADGGAETASPEEDMEEPRPRRL
jgi:NhaP-type Na+/H+ or K+/H+ antiporter